mmetsp:Transcript_33290/g.45600  ORF Transcript_33290/g.45600 Transcript_33290/m.45600 type:complete len:336 (+) Transcript_33290:1-1008(+)
MVYKIATESCPVIGKSTALEKTYTRLQGRSDPNYVRSETVLRKSFEYVQERAKLKPTLEESLKYLGEQYKSIRQDLVIQHVENIFTIEVLEAHARLTLELGDLLEFNQLQGRIQALHRLPCCSARETRYEFGALHLIYCALMGNAGGIAAEFTALTLKDMGRTEIQHAECVVRAAATENVFKLIQLYYSAPSRYTQLLLRRLFQEKRTNWLLQFLQSRAPKSKIKLSQISRALGFDVENDDTLIQEESGMKKASLSTRCITSKHVSSSESSAVADFLAKLSISTNTDSEPLHFSDANFQDRTLECSIAVRQITEHIKFIHTREDAQHAQRSVSTL